MKNAVFWDIETQFLPHRKHGPPLQSPAGYCYESFEVFTAVTVKNVVFWVVMPCDSCKNRRFGWILIMEALPSSETSVLTRATRRNIQEGNIIHFHQVSYSRIDSVEKGLGEDFTSLGLPVSHWFTSAGLNNLEHIITFIRCYGVLWVSLNIPLLREPSRCFYTSVQ
jgi:hypothetical protein